MDSFNKKKIKFHEKIALKGLPVGDIDVVLMDNDFGYALQKLECCLTCPFLNIRL